METIITPQFRPQSAHDKELSFVGHLTSDLTLAGLN